MLPIDTINSSNTTLRILATAALLLVSTTAAVSIIISMLASIRVMGVSITVCRWGRCRALRFESTVSLSLLL